MSPRYFGQPEPASQHPQSPSATTPASALHPLLQLQAATGNRATNRAIAAHRQSPADRSLSQTKPMFRGLSQELGGNLSQGSPIQAKLAIGQPGDRYEQEADRTASEVVNRIHATQNQAIQFQESRHGSEQKIQRSSFTPLASTPLNQQPAGNEIPATPDLAASIQQSRGRGQLLPDTIREPMEQAFGADFSQVRVHTSDQSNWLNQSLQSRAFTTGQDIFFRQGAYHPTSPKGQKLVAHELTHVLQQGGGRGVKLPLTAATQPIQRALGMEFECSNLAITNRPTGTKKGDEIARGKHRPWKMVYETTSAGQPVVEFVVEPAAETEKEITDAVKGMQERAKKLDRKSPTVIGEYTIKKEGTIEGAIQITIGTPLENLPGVYKKFGELDISSAYQKYQALVRDQGESSEQTPDGGYVKDLPGETKGLILLLMDYIRRGYVREADRKDAPDKTTHKHDYDQWEESGIPFIKGLFDVMARNDFTSIFGTLSESEQDRLSDKDEDTGKRQMKPEWVEWIVGNAIRPWNAVKKALEDPLSSGEVTKLASDNLINQKIKGWDTIGADPKRGEWLTEMPRQDLLTEKGYMGIGKMGKKMDELATDSTVKAPIFELRAPYGSSVYYKEWLTKARESWTKYTAVVDNQRINRGGKGSKA